MHKISAIDKNSAFAYSKFIVRKSGRKFKQKMKDFGFVFIPSGFLAYKRSSEMVPVFFESLHGFNEPEKRGAAEVKTAQIAYLASEFSGSGNITALNARSVCDLNRGENARKSLSFHLNRKMQKEGAEHYLRSVSGLADELMKGNKIDKEHGMILIVSIHGMKDRRKRDIDVGSGRGKLCKRSIARWFARELYSHLESHGLAVRINVDKGFSGGAHPKKLRDHEYLGKRLQYLQIEISNTLRKTVPYELAVSLAKIAARFDHRHWGQTSKKIQERSERPVLEGRVKGMEIDPVEPIDRIYIDRSQRVYLKTRRGNDVLLMRGNGSAVKLNVHQARYFQIGENKIVLNRKLMEKLRLKDGQKVSIVNNN